MMESVPYNSRDSSIFDLLSNDSLTIQTPISKASNPLPNQSKPSRSIQILSSAPSMNRLDLNEQKWYDHVKIDLNTVTPQEMKRQQVIYEIIKTEEKYVSDLEYIENVMDD